MTARSYLWMRRFPVVWPGNAKKQAITRFGQWPGSQPEMLSCGDCIWCLLITPHQGSCTSLISYHGTQIMLWTENVTLAKPVGHQTVCHQAVPFNLQIQTWDMKPQHWRSSPEMHTYDVCMRGWWKLTGKPSATEHVLAFVNVLPDSEQLFGCFFFFWFWV